MGLGDTQTHNKTMRDMATCIECGSRLTQETMPAHPDDYDWRCMSNREHRGYRIINANAQDDAMVHSPYPAMRAAIARRSPIVAMAKDAVIMARLRSQYKLNEYQSAAFLLHCKAT
ncbi:hypothetical protein LCGC14_2358080, partial [marine sediment metagenome]